MSSGNSSDGGDSNFPKGKIHNNWNTLNYFHPNRTDLAQEVSNHPELVKLLANHRSDDFELMLAEIGIYVGVILDGEYSQLDIDGVCKVLKEKLVTKRIGIKFASEIVVQ